MKKIKTDKKLFLNFSNHMVNYFFQGLRTALHRVNGGGSLAQGRDGQVTNLKTFTKLTKPDNLKRLY
jgi:hypothetical protein